MMGYVFSKRKGFRIIVVVLLVVALLFSCNVIKVSAVDTMGGIQESSESEAVIDTIPMPENETEQTGTLNVGDPATTETAESLTEETADPITEKTTDPITEETTDSITEATTDAPDTLDTPDKLQAPATKVQTAGSEPSFKSYVYLVQFSGDGKDTSKNKYYYGTEDAPAMIDYYEMVQGGGYRIRAVLEYENLEPNTTYNVNLHAKCRNHSPTANVYGQEETSETGRGEWVFQVNLGQYSNSRYEDMYDIDWDISKDGTTYTIKHEDYGYDAVYCINSLVGQIVADKDYMGGEYEEALVPTAAAADGVDLTYNATFPAGLWEGDYTMSLQLVHILSANTSENIGEPIEKKFTVDEYQYYMRKSFDMGNFKGLEDGETYAVLATLTPTYAANTMQNQSLTNMYTQFLIYDRERIVETKDRVAVEITNYDGDSDVVLEGAVFVLEDEDGNIIDTWTGGKAPHQFDLLPGKYAIRQTKAPKGYKLAEDIEFEVKDEDTKISGQIFQATGHSDLLLTIVNAPSIYRTILQAYRKGDDANKFYSYCINLGKLTPSENDAFSQNDLHYREDYAGEELLYSQTTNKEISSKELKESLIRVLYNGYSNDALGLMEKYNLTKEYFIDATQKAVWHFTNGVTHTSQSFSKEPGAYEAYTELINAKNDVPDNVSAHIYIPDSGNYQDMIAAQIFLDEVMNLEVRNFKEEPEKEQTEPESEPEEQTEPESEKESGSEPEEEQTEPESETEPGPEPEKGLTEPESETEFDKYPLNEVTKITKPEEVVKAVDKPVKTGDALAAKVELMILLMFMTSLTFSIMLILRIRAKREED